MLKMSSPVVGKFVEARNIKGGRHIKLAKTSHLFKKRGISDIWCYTKPKTGNPMLYLEDKMGKLIRQFDLKNQMEQVRYYFQQANKEKFMTPLEKAIYLKKEVMDEIEKEISRGNINYYVHGREYDTYGLALKALFAARPELKDGYYEYYKMDINLKIAAENAIKDENNL